MTITARHQAGSHEESIARYFRDQYNYFMPGCWMDLQIEDARNIGYDEDNSRHIKLNVIVYEAPIRLSDYPMSVWEADTSTAMDTMISRDQYKYERREFLALVTDIGNHILAKANRVALDPSMWMQLNPDILDFLHITAEIHHQYHSMKGNQSIDDIGMSFAQKVIEDAVT